MITTGVALFTIAAIANKGSDETDVLLFFVGAVFIIIGVN